MARIEWPTTWRKCRKVRSLPKAQPNFRFHVYGRGEFPLDMLRYDECRPCGDADIEAIAGGEYIHERRSVTLVTDNRFIHPARWASFGWRVRGVEGDLGGLYGVDTAHLPQVQEASLSRSGVGV